MVSSKKWGFKGFLATRTKKSKPVISVVNNGVVWLKLMIWFFENLGLFFKDQGNFLSSVIFEFEMLILKDHGTFFLDKGDFY